MNEHRTPSRLAGRDTARDALPDVHFVRVPSIAERKLGAGYVAPMRLDPRLLQQMQTTIKDLEAKYADTLKSQVAMLHVLVKPACETDIEARSRLYSIAHDMRGLAGTFGHPIVGRFADSLCRYIETSEAADWTDSTVIRFHIDAIGDALENPDTDPAITLETLNALERLIATAARNRRRPG